jgi:Prokaryotic cytochrome b561
MTVADPEPGDSTKPRAPSTTGAERKPRLPRALKIDFWLDSILLVAFLAAESFHLTGLVLHEWIGVTMGVALLVHITLHWNWVVRTTSRLFRKKPGRDTIRWANNLFLMLAMTLTVASGLWSSRVVLTTFGLPEGQEDFWLQVHFWCADLSLFSVALHVALGWRWILTTGKRILRRRAANGSRSVS